ncbi:MAG: CpaD family pilus assembly lipoprotein [Bdellovibrionales bacterium]|jgi:hypothetical protein
MSRYLFSTLAVLVLLSGCAATPAPDMRIKLMLSADGSHLVPVPPECASWREAANTPLENQNAPQYGCAEAKNLAAQVERPEDLVQGQPLGSADGTFAAASVGSYHAGRTKPLIDAWSAAPVAAASSSSGGTTP